MNNTDRTSLIDELADDLVPVHPMYPRQGLAWVAGGAVTSLAIVLATVGLRAGIDHASALFYITNGLLLVLGAAAASSVVVMATPQVGNRHDTPKWAAAMVAVLPFAMAIALLRASGNWHERIDPLGGWHCAAYGLLSGLAAAVAMIWWLRRGAPTSPRLAGLYTGVAAGALGSVAYGISCAQDSIYHLGSWHILPVIVAGALGWAVLPRLLRW